MNTPQRLQSFESILCSLARFDDVGVCLHGLLFHHELLAQDHFVIVEVGLDAVLQLEDVVQEVVVEFEVAADDAFYLCLPIKYRLKVEFSLLLFILPDSFEAPATGVAAA